MPLLVGQYVWVPCEVKPGPFSDERMVRVNSPVGRWAGFVHTSRLREPVAAGLTEATALVVEVHNDRFRAQPIGEPLSNTLYDDLVSRAQPIGTLKA
jgi:hypothetical protein